MSDSDSASAAFIILSQILIKKRSEHVRTHKNALSNWSNALVPFTSSKRAFLEYSIEQRKNALDLFTLNKFSRVGVE